MTLLAFAPSVTSYIWTLFCKSRKGNKSVWLSSSNVSTTSWALVCHMCLQHPYPNNFFSGVFQWWHHRRQRTRFSQDRLFRSKVRFCRKVFMKNFLTLVCFDVALLPILCSSLKKTSVNIWFFWAREGMKGFFQEHRMKNNKNCTFLCCHSVSSHARQLNCVSLRLNVWISKYKWDKLFKIYMYTK